MKNNDLVSIIIPVYKTEKKYLINCIKSIESQEYKNYEIILVDDGNPKEYKDVLYEIRKDIEKVRIIHKENGGASSARNLGLIEANGEYITFVDADDSISKDFISQAVSYMDEYSLDIVIGGYQVEEVKHLPECSDIILYQNTEIEKIKQLFVSGFSTKDTKYLKNCLGIVAPWAKMFRRKSITGIIFDESLILSEDTLFNLYCLDKVNKVGVVSKCWYNYSVVENSICHSYRENALYEINISTQKFEEFLNLSLQNRNKFQEAYKFRMLRQLYHLLIYCYCNLSYKNGSPVSDIKKFLNDNKDIYRNLNDSKTFYLPKSYRILRLLAKHQCSIGIYIFFKLKLYLKKS
ncbi:MAG: glycosyltransferase family 2 protein [Clostridium sp.]|uniref:glycosyltransferase family 2 protein n=1 Tax=Clostridium sp. TaxID=1506 RepID=UPI0029110BC0|nr:glycosyltransferase family 2 protein [Clostridium sp.]MDU5110389.1 glycosyltransferase family 2 protein [Clostridium sp.]